ncbi:MAG: aminotransferase class IV [Bacteroidales bacterium]|nr:aminotransferase class IV [Bacteroidales bacterium]
MRECLGKQFIHNGNLTDTSAFDDSFLKNPHYIYEVFRVIDGVALFLEDHLGRLKKTCELSEHCHGFSFGDIYRQVYEVIKANNFSYGNLKMVLYRNDQKNSHFMIYITEHQYPTPQQFEKGIPVALFKGIRNNPNAKVMDVKLRNATNLIKQEMEVYETLLVDDDRCITEGSRSNVFFIRHGKVITPPLHDVLPGITRKHIIEVCRNLLLPVTEEKVSARSVVVMEGVFITGTSRKVLPVNRIDDLEFDANHPITRQIQNAFNDVVEKYITEHSKTKS